MVHRRTADLVGESFGRLKVLSISKKEKGNIYLLCECMCGVQKEVMRQNLTTGKTKSCGCLFRESRVSMNRKRSVYTGKKDGTDRVGKKISSSEIEKIINMYFIDCEESKDIGDLYGVSAKHIQRILRVEYAKLDVKDYISENDFDNILDINIFKKLKRLLKISQTEIAVILKISNATVNNWEAEIRTIPSHYEDIIREYFMEKYNIVVLDSQ